MTRAGDLVENAVTRERVLVRVGCEDTSGRYLVADTCEVVDVPPGTVHGRVSARGLPSLLQLAVLAREFDDVVRFSSPPRWVQRAVIAVRAPVARLRGVRATYAHHGPLDRRLAQDAEHATRRAA